MGTVPLGSFYCHVLPQLWECFAWNVLIMAPESQLFREPWNEKPEKAPGPPTIKAFSPTRRGVSSVRCLLSHALTPVCAHDLLKPWLGTNFPESRTTFQAWGRGTGEEDLLLTETQLGWCPVLRTQNPFSCTGHSRGKGVPQYWGQ